MRIHIIVSVLVFGNISFDKSVNENISSGIFTRLRKYVVNFRINAVLAFAAKNLLKIQNHVTSADFSGI